MEELPSRLSDIRDEIEMTREPIWSIRNAVAGLAFPLWLIAFNLAYIAYQLS